MFDQEVEMAQAKERHRRLNPGTLVVGTRPFQAQEETVSPAITAQCVGVDNTAMPSRT